MNKGFSKLKEQVKGKTKQDLTAKIIFLTSIGVIATLIIARFIGKFIYFITH